MNITTKFMKIIIKSITSHYKIHERPIKTPSTILEFPAFPREVAWVIPKAARKASAMTRQCQLVSNVNTTLGPKIQKRCCFQGETHDSS